MLIPYGTDAPIYYFPFATIATIIINVVVFAIQLVNPDVTDFLVLTYGDINPLSWITAAYAHAGFGHIIGNMLFLAAFGIIVEGKIGWWKFLIIYNVIAFAASALIAAIMFMFPGGTGLGASCAITGIMVIAMIWAPENEIFVHAIFVIWFRPLIFSFEVSVLIAAFFHIALDFLFAVVDGFGMSSATAHLLGAVPGAVVGLGMIFSRTVDCEGYDLVSQLRGKRGQRVKTRQQEKEDQEFEDQEQQRIEAEYQKGMAMCKKYIEAGHFEMARKRFAVVQKVKPGLIMPEAWVVRMIKGSTETDGSDNEKSIELLVHYLQNYQRLQVPVTLRVAKYRIETEERPRRALKLLQTIQEAKMEKSQIAIFNRLAKAARQQIADGVIELDEL